MSDGINPPAVTVTNLSKVFPGVRALDRVDLTIGPNEVHCLVGGNGSGKSTLTKILCGVQTGEAGGTIRVADQEVEASHVDPGFAMRAGVHVVHQDLGLFPDLSVAENLALGLGYETRSGLIRRRNLVAGAKELIGRFDIPAKPDTPLRSLTQANRTLVAIARALREDKDHPTKLLILDEPTASLTGREAESLLATAREQARSGCPVLYISHKFSEVLGVANLVTVLRDGQKVGTFAASELDNDKLVHLVAGKFLTERRAQARQAGPDRPLLSLKGVSAGAIRGVDLVVNSGEVVGIAGLVGSGRSTLLKCVLGEVRLSAGEIILDEEEVRFGGIADAVQSGIAYVPENRAEEAAFAELSVASNLTMARIPDFAPRGWVSERRMRRDADTLISDFSIKTPGGSVLMETLSGGNQQKVVLARWLARKPRVILLDEPTQGVDVKARAEIYSMVRAAAAGGAAVLVVESDLDELVAVVDRAIVLRDGEIVGSAAAADTSPNELTAAAQF